VQKKAKGVCNDLSLSNSYSRGGKSYYRIFTWTKREPGAAGFFNEHMPSGLDDKTLTGYLLGELSEAQRTRVEEQLFSDRECYDRLQALKAELTDRFVRETLTPEQGAVFARRFLATEIGRDDALFARALGDVLREREEQRNPATPATMEQLHVSWWPRLGAFFRLAPGWQAAMAMAIVALMIGMSWLLIERHRMDQRLETAISERDAAQSGARKAAQLEEEMGRLSSRNRELDQRLQQTRKALEELEITTRQSRTTSTIGAILSLILAPGARRGNERVERLIIVPQTRVVRLQLLLEPGETGKGYRAEVRTKGGSLIHSQNRLRSHQSDLGKALLVEIPADRLNDGLYEVTLIGATQTGRSEIINYYDFGVTRRF
jgi:anti-sigma factor RsiW